jgi:hypothetical protein
LAAATDAGDNELDMEILIRSSSPLTPEEIGTRESSHEWKRAIFKEESGLWFQNGTAEKHSKGRTVGGRPVLY